MGRDRIAKDQRYRAMAANHGRTRPELALASMIWRRGLRYYTAAGYKGRTSRALLGQPDLVFPHKRAVVFVDGCFWHGCPSCKGIPQQSGEFWRAKIERNVARDCRVTETLEADGWTVVRVLEHELRPVARLQATADALAARLHSMAGSRYR